MTKEEKVYQNKQGLLNNMGISNPNQRTKEDLENAIEALRSLANDFEDEISDGQYNDELARKVIDPSHPSSIETIQFLDKDHAIGGMGDEFTPDKTKEDLPALNDGDDLYPKNTPNRFKTQPSPEEDASGEMPGWMK